MKKIIYFIAIMFSLLFISSCGSVNPEYAGTYEMTSISGSITYNGQTTQLDESLYDYYRIILNEDGTAKVESKSANTSDKISEDGTWTASGKTIMLVSKPSGIPVVEKMEYNDGIITFHTDQSAQGMSITMTLILKKVQ